MVLMTIAVGLCLFDGDEHETADSGAAFDLCFGLAITSIAAVVLAFVSMHDLPVDPRNVVHAVPLRRLDSPPKSPLSTGDHHRRSGCRVPALLRAGEACSRRDWEGVW